MYRSVALIGVALIMLGATNGFGYTDGDALQLQTYRVASGDEPNVTDGDIANTDPLDWKSASVRVVEMVNTSSNDTANMTILLNNNSSTLYLAVVGELPNASEQNDLEVYFDIDNDGILEGASGNPGEYFVRVRADLSGNVADGGWDGSTWVDNSTAATGLEGNGLRKGTSGSSRLYNYEVAIPLNPAAVNGNSYLEASGGDEVGIILRIVMNDGSHYYWDGTSFTVAQSDGWGELEIADNRAAVRDVAALYAKSYIPTIDGNISDDPNWQYAYEKSVTFTNYAGTKMTNGKILFKQDASNLYIGVRIPFTSNDNSSYLRVYFDQGAAGGDRDFILNGGTPYDDAMDVTGNNSYADRYFNGTNWTADNTAHGDGKIHQISGEALEYEFVKPLNSGDNEDISLTSGDVVGLMMQFYDNNGGSEYFWSATINEDIILLDPIDGTNENAIGWASLTTGAPFVQPVYPEQSDIISGTYVLMVYAEDIGDGVVGIDSVDYRITDLNDEIILDYSSSRTLSKVDNNSSGLWTATFNTNTGSTPDGEYNLEFRVLENGGVRATVPVRITIQNSGTIGGPVVSIDNLQSGDVVSGDTAVSYTANPTAGNTLVKDSIQIRIDGNSWATVDTSLAPNISGGTGTDTVKTSQLSDGVHTLRMRAKDSGDETWGYSELVIFNVDNQASTPRVSITAPADSAVKSDSVTIMFDVAVPTGRTLAATEIAVDGANWTGTTTNASHQLDTRGYPDGTHLIQVRATDNLGRTGYSQPIAIIVKNAPVVSLTAPGGGITATGKIGITWSSTTTSAIDSAWLMLDGAYIMDLVGDGTDSLDTSPLSDGEHTVQVRVRDSYGRIGMSEIVTVPTRNEPTVTLEAPLAGAEVSGKVGLEYTPQAMGTAVVDSAWLMLDGTYKMDLVGDGTDSLDTSPLSDGEHTVQVRVRDSYGRVGMSEIFTILTRNEPIVTIDAPMAGAQVSGKVGLEYTLQAMGTSTVDSVWLRVDGGFYQALSTTGTDTVNTTVLPDGEHTIQFVVRDDQGRTGQSNALTLLVRNAPAVVLNTPGGGARLWATIGLDYTATPKGTATVDSLWLMINGKFYSSLDLSGTDSLNTLALSDGEHSMQVRAIDDQGKTGVSELISVTVVNRPVVLFTSPAAGTAVADPVRISFDVLVPGQTAALDTQYIDSVMISVDGAPYRATLTKSEDIIDTKGMQDGSHIVKVQAYVNGGKRGATEERLFVVDNTAPSASNPTTSYADDGTAARAGSEVLVTVQVVEHTTILKADSAVILTSDSLDPSGSVTYVMHDDGLDGDLVAADDVFSALVTVNATQSGIVPFSVTATDSLGNAVILQSAIRLDNEAPTTELMLLSRDSTELEATDTSFHEFVIMNAVHFDSPEGSGLHWAYVSVTNESDTNIANSPIPLSSNHDKSSMLLNLGAGTNVIRLVAKDHAGNIDTMMQTITNLDNIPPEIRTFTLSPRPDTTGANGMHLSYFDRLVLKARYRDQGGSLLSRVFVTVVNDSGDHVNNSPIDLAPDDTTEVSRIVDLVEGVNYITLTARDHSGNMTSLTDTIEYREPKATTVVDRDGGELLSPDRASVAIPKHALLHPTEITIVPISEDEQRKPLNDNVELLNVAHDFGPDGTVFRKPVEVTLPYTDADLDRDQDGVRDIDPMNLTVVFWDGGTWRTAGPSAVDTAEGTVSVSVNHFTIYDLAVVQSKAPKKLIAYWTANPVKHSSGAYFTYNVPKAGTVGLRVVDMAGDVVAQLIENGTDVAPSVTPYSVVWRGENVSGRFAGAGLYVYVFTYTDGNTNNTTVVRKPIGLLR